MKILYRYIRILFLRLLGLVYGRKLRAFEHIVILAPHPDDETFGCYALIQRQLEQGHKVSVVFLTDGEASHHNCCSVEPIEIATHRQRLAEMVNKDNAGNLYYLHLSDGSIQVESPSIEQVRKVVKTLRPDAIFVPHHFEGWQDHINTNRIGSRIAKESGAALYEYCVWFWISMSYFKALQCRWRNCYYLASNREAKRSAAAVYTQSLAPCGKPWSGQLHRQFIEANLGKRELYFKND